MECHTKSKYKDNTYYPKQRKRTLEQKQEIYASTSRPDPADLDLERQPGLVDQPVGHAEVELQYRRVGSA